MVTKKTASKTTKKVAKKKAVTKKTVAASTTKRGEKKKEVKASKKTASKATSKPSSAKATGGKKEEAKVILRIRVRAYEHKILDTSVKQIIDTAMRHDARLVGPVPLPTEIKKYTVNRSPFVFKDSREQFEIRTHKRMIDILDPSPKTVESLTNLSLPSGVHIDVKMM